MGLTLLYLLFQFSTEFRGHLSRLRLQLIEEVTFNTDEKEDNVGFVINTLKVSAISGLFIDI